jgi:hypothetical protein
MKSKARKQRFIKEKIASMFSIFSGSLSLLSSWQVCHNLCLAIIVVLSMIGITIVGMPLLFLTKYAHIFWFIAVLLLILNLVMYWKNRRRVSKNLIFVNIGILIAAKPFDLFQSYQLLFFVIGGTIIVYSFILSLRSKLK